MSSTHQRFATMDGLRGVAAVLVVFYHLQTSVPFGGAFSSAYLAVDFFFILSGFVVTLAYEERLRCGMGLRAFMWVRLARLYPLIVLGALIGWSAAAAPALWPQFSPEWLKLSLRDVVRAVFLIPRLRGDAYLFPLNIPMWSLLFELLINVAYALYLHRVNNFVLSCICALGAATVLWAAFAHGNLNVGSDVPTFGGGLARVTWAFPAGVLTYRWFKKGYLSGLPHVPTILLFGALLAACASPVPAELAPVRDCFSALVLFPAIVAFATQPQPGGAITGLFKWLGVLSYPIYTIHSGLQQWASVAADWGLGPKAWLLALASLAVIPVAWMADLWWDTPLRGFATGRRLKANTKVTSHS